MAIGRVNTGGGGSGGTLTVTGVAGHTVTATKDGKTYTRTINSNGVAVFKGLATGTWTLTMTGDGQTATRTVTVTADYAVTITYFSATINVTYPAGSTCTATDGVTTLTATDTSGTWACVVPNAGTWTVTATNGTNTKSESVEITSEGQSVSVTLSYQLILFDGGVVVPWKVIQAKPTATISDTIYLHANDPTTPVVSAVRTTNKINLSGYSILKYTVTENVNPEVAFMCVTSSTSAPINAGLSNAVTSAVTAYGQPTATGTYSVDVSEVQGEYYVSIAEGHYPTSGLKVSKVWLE